MENFAQNYVKFDIFGTFLFKKGVNPKSLVAALAGGARHGGHHREEPTAGGEEDHSWRGAGQN